jgi:hypothetical protein
VYIVGYIHVFFNFFETLNCQFEKGAEWCPSSKSIFWRFVQILRIFQFLEVTYPTNRGAPWEILSYDYIDMKLLQNSLAPCNNIEVNMSWIVDDLHWYRISSSVVVLLIKQKLEVISSKQTYNCLNFWCVHHRHHPS